MKLICVMAVVLTLGQTWLHAQEPAKPDEKRVGKLIRELGDDNLRRRAEAELIEIGAPSALPLIESLRQVSSGRAWNLGHAESILRTLGALGPSATAGIPVLIEALRELPVEALPQVLRTLGQVGPWDRRQIETVRQAIWQTLDAVRTQQKSVEVGAAITGGVALVEARLKVDPHAPIEEVLELLSGGDVSLPRFAVEILRHRRLAAREALPQLSAWLSILERIKSSDPRPTFLPDPDLLAEVMVAIDSEDPLTIVAHVRRLRHEDPRVRQRSAMALGRQGGVAKHAVKDLVKALQDASPLVVREAITALGMIGPAAKDAIPALDELTDHHDRQIRERARAALRQVRGM